jgi:hypothetical protein
MSEKETSELSKKLDRVLYILDNDEKTGRKGLVSSVYEIRNELDDVLEANRTAEAVKKGQMAIYGAIGAFCLWLLGILAKLCFPFLFKFI